MTALIRLSMTVPGMVRFKLRQRSLFRPLAALALLLLADVVAIPGFFQLQLKEGHLYGSVIDIVNRAAPLILVSLGMTLVVAARGIDISVGAVVAISGSVAALLTGGSAAPQLPLMVALSVALGVALLCGLWNGLLITVLGLQPIVATLILMVSGRGLAQLLTDGQIVTIYYEPYFYLGSGYLFGLPVALYVAIGAALITALLLRRTALGMFLRVLGSNPVAARMAGVNTAALLVIVYAFCSACAGVAGLIVSSSVKSADANNAGLLLELDAILAVTLGGTSLAGGQFNLAGSVVGALIIQTLTYTIYSLGVPPELNMLLKAVVVFAVCLAQSTQFRQRLGFWKED